MACKDPLPRLQLLLNYQVKTMIWFLNNNCKHSNLKLWTFDEQLQKQMFLLREKRPILLAKTFACNLRWKEQSLALESLIDGPIMPRQKFAINSFMADAELLRMFLGINMLVLPSAIKKVYIWTYKLFHSFTIWCWGNAELEKVISKGLQTYRCLQPKLIGNCRSSIPSFYYDATTGVCRPFNFSGCDGNSNNFGSVESCERACMDPDFIPDLPPSISN